MDEAKERELYMRWYQKMPESVAPYDAWLARARIAEEWLPIESAPKDDTILIAGTYPHNGIAWVKVGFWLDNQKRWHGHFGAVIENPTHWCALPSPPAATAAQAAEGE